MLDGILTIEDFFLIKDSDFYSKDSVFCALSQGWVSSTRLCNILSVNDLLILATTLFSKKQLMLLAYSFCRRVLHVYEESRKNNKLRKLLHEYYRYTQSELESLEKQASISFYLWSTESVVFIKNAIRCIDIAIRHYGNLNFYACEDYQALKSITESAKFSCAEEKRWLENLYQKELLKVYFSDIA